MALLVSSWVNDIQSVPADYIMPPESRPGNFLTISKEIPVIDLGEEAGHDHADLVQKIMKACQEFGLFQVINHGVPEKMMEDTMNLYKEFFKMPVEDKLSVYTEDRSKACKLYTSGLNTKADHAKYWKDSLMHPCHPLQEHTPSWPDKPARYREEVGKYAIEVRELGLRILDLISEGLGLKDEVFRGKCNEAQIMGIHHYPPCPDPSLAMGITNHADNDLITVLQQDAYGLQLLKDGEWIGVEPLPNAFVVNLGAQLQIISNGKLHCPEHRGVTSSKHSRTSIVTLIAPAHLTVIEPAKELITPSSPQLFEPNVYKKFW